MSVGQLIIQTLDAEQNRVTYLDLLSMAGTKLAPSNILFVVQ